ncbi:hypothetical protein BGX31_004259, partial [Mortierella sp. GBA43]
DATIQDVRGLSQVNEQLLKQRGALGEPLHRLREASKKLTSMASALFKFKSPTHNMEAESSATNLTDDHAVRASSSADDQGVLVTISSGDQASLVTNSTDAQVVLPVEQDENPLL